MNYTDETQEMESTVTSEYYVDAYDSVYDESGLFYCKWIALTSAEKKIVKSNPASAR